jgi:hypothetical protein
LDGVAVSTTVILESSIRAETICPAAGAFVATNAEKSMRLILPLFWIWRVETPMANPAALTLKVYLVIGWTCSVLGCGVFFSVFGDIIPRLDAVKKLKNCAKSLDAQRMKASPPTVRNAGRESAKHTALHQEAGKVGIAVRLRFLSCGKGMG